MDNQNNLQPVLKKLQTLTDAQVKSADQMKKMMGSFQTTLNAFNKSLNSKSPSGKKSQVQLVAADRDKIITPLNKILKVSEQNSKTLSSLSTTLQKQFEHQKKEARKEASNRKSAQQREKRMLADLISPKTKKVVASNQEKKSSSKGFLASLLGGGIGATVGPILGGLGAILGVVGTAAIAYINKDWIEKNFLNPIGKWWKDTALPFISETFYPWMQKNVLYPMGDGLKLVADNFVSDMGSILSTVTTNIAEGLGRVFNDLLDPFSGGSRPNANRSFSTTSAQELGSVAGVRSRDASLSQEERDAAGERARASSARARRSGAARRRQ